MSALNLPDCICEPDEPRHPASGHAKRCPLHALSTVYIPEKEGAMQELKVINWRVIDADGNEFLYYAPHCNADANGILAIGGPGMVLAIFGPGEWSRIENLDVVTDGVARWELA